MSVFGGYPLLIATLAGAALLAGCAQTSRPVSSQRPPTMGVSIVVNVEIYDPEESPAGQETPVLAEAPAVEQPPAAADRPDLGGINRIFFAFDSAAIRDSQRSMIRNWGDWLKAHPGWGLRIEGHTDE